MLREEGRGKREEGRGKKALDTGHRAECWGKISRNCVLTKFIKYAQREIG